MTIRREMEIDELLRRVAALESKFSAVEKLFESGEWQAKRLGLPTKADLARPILKLNPRITRSHDLPSDTEA